jgi:hypothetical protein
MKSREFVGINIQFPISRLILSGQKTVETRTYPIPKKFVGQEIAIVETPGKSGKFKSRIIATAIFGESFKYDSSKDFYDDIERHRVDRKSPWAWKANKPKWGWPVEVTNILAEPVTVRRQLGIKYTNGLKIS